MTDRAVDTGSLQSSVRLGQFRDEDLQIGICLALTVFLGTPDIESVFQRREEQRLEGCSKLGFGRDSSVRG